MTRIRLILTTRLLAPSMHAFLRICVRCGSREGGDGCCGEKRRSCQGGRCAGASERAQEGRLRQDRHAHYGEAKGEDPCRCSRKSVLLTNCRFFWCLAHSEELHVPSGPAPFVAGPRVSPLSSHGHVFAISDCRRTEVACSDGREGYHSFPLARFQPCPAFRTLAPMSQSCVVHARKPEGSDSTMHPRTCAMSSRFLFLKLVYFTRCHMCRCCSFQVTEIAYVKSEGLGDVLSRQEAGDRSAPFPGSPGGGDRVLRSPAQEVLRLVASAERGSEHPLAKVRLVAVACSSHWLGST